MSQTKKDRAAHAKDKPQTLSTGKALTLADVSVAARTEEELQALSTVIDYADRKISEERELRDYRPTRDIAPPIQDFRPLRRHAYGKTVIIETEHEGVLTFRLGSTPLIAPGPYATPHSPVGRLCAILQPGDKGQTPKWGSYHVHEIRLLARTIREGTDFHRHARKFGGVMA